MRRVLLFVVYFLLVTPVGLLSRLTWDPLHRRWRAGAASYWLPSTGGGEGSSWWTFPR